MYAATLPLIFCMHHGSGTCESNGASISALFCLNFPSVNIKAFHRGG